MPEVVGPLLAHVTVTFVPGLAIALALGLHGWLLAAAAPLVTYGLIGVAGSALPLIGITWSPLSFAVTAALVAVAAAGLRQLAALVGPQASAAPRLTPWSRVHHGGVALAVVIAAAVGAEVAYAATSGFTAVPQVWDAVFHANATRYIADTGQSNPAALQSFNNPTSDSFYYPNAYHVLAATVVMLTSSSVPTVLDTSTALFPALLALSIVALVRQTGGRPAFAAAAGLLSCAFTAFPYDLLPWGTLLPFIVSVALLPAFLAIGATALSRTTGTAIVMPVALALAGIGLLALHPSGAVAASVLGVALLLQLWVQRRPRLDDLRVIGLAAVAAVALGWPLLRASVGAAAGPAFDWPAYLRPPDAMGQLFFLGHGQLYPQYWLVVLSVVGLFRTATLRPVLWFVVGSVLFAGLFVMAVSYENDLVALLTRPWWNDGWRLAALWALGSLLLAAAGLVGVRDGLWAAIRQLAPALDGVTERRRLAISVSLLAVVAIAVVALTDGLYRGRNETRLAQAFTDGPTVSTKERAAFDVLARIVPEDTMVMNDPYDGSALMWALNDVRPVFASPVIAPQELPTMDPNRRILFESFNQLDTNAAVQRAVDELNIEYAIICTGFIAPAADHAPGMQRLDQVAALDLVYQNDDARIYTIGRDGPIEPE